MTKEYLLDGEPVAWTELIKAAREIDDDYDRNDFKSTSEAAQILRANGHIVGYNKD